MRELTLINAEQQQALARLLEECPSMKDRRRRKLVFQRLRSEIQRCVDPEGSLDCVVSEMVAGCADFTDGIEELVRATADADGPTIQIKRLWNSLPGILGFFDAEIHSTISAALKNFTKENIRRECIEDAFKKTVSDQLRVELGIPETNEMCRWRMLKEAENIGRGHDGRFPFAIFVRRLFPDIKSKEMKLALVQWASHTTGEPVGSFKSLPGDVDSGEIVRPYLIVRLTPNPSAADSDRYNMTFHVHRENKCRGFPADVDEEKEFQPVKVAEALDEFLCKNFDRDARPRAVEVMMPGDRLTSVNPPPHLWPLKKGRRHPVLLGRQYSVYLRLDRYGIPPDLRAEWEVKWERLKAATGAPETIHWECDPAGCTWETLEEKLNRSDGSPCLMLAFQPEGNAEWLADALHDLSLPAALWGDGAKQEIEKLLEGGSLRRLPEHIQIKRKDSGEKKSELPHQLTLLWDNPKRDIHAAGPAADQREAYHYDMDVLS